MEKDVRQILDVLIAAFKKAYPELQHHPEEASQAAIGFENFLAIAVSYGWEGGRYPFALECKSQPAFDRQLSNRRKVKARLVPEPRELGRFGKLFADLREEILRNYNKVRWPGFGDFTVCRVPFPKDRITVLIEPAPEAAEYVNRALMAHYPIFARKARKRT